MNCSKNKEQVSQSKMTIIHQLVLAIVSSNTCSQIHVQMKHSLRYDIIPTRFSPYFGCCG